MNKENQLNSISGILAVLFFYAAVSKLMNYDQSKQEMLNQVFPRSIGEVLTWLVPTVELLLVGILLFTTTRLMGLWLSLILMIAFTLYIGIVMTGVFGRVPCSCGSLLKNMPYSIHLFFNIFFVALAGLGIYIEKRGRIKFNRWFHFNEKEANR